MDFNQTLDSGARIDQTYLKLLVGNERFVAAKLAQDPLFFEKLKNTQTPQVLWIGCADSRVPADQITGTQPGEIFVHRNIANLVVHSDMNVLSTIDYAVEHLGVRHVIVCGHYGCGGVRAALSAQNLGLIDNWLRNIKDVYRLHQDELEALPDQDSLERRLVELNVIEQVYNVCKTSTVQKAWKEHGRPFVHGWVYDVGNGIIKDLEVNVSGRGDLESIYRFDVDKSLASRTPQ